MEEQANASANPRDTVKLKLLETQVSSEDPWNDDVLGREELAAKLTNVIRNQTEPFAITVDGSWGTGKTFLLQRWQANLEDDGYKAIYFNAWEDDFCNDPLLAILGQLSEYFKDGKLKSLVGKVIRIAGTLFKQNAINVIHKHIGISLVIEKRDQGQSDLLKEYLEQRATKDKLKQHLENLAKTILEETGHPLIFIIDELDRCRPTFAIELLERVKHIFDVPNLVFVFGINRGELCSALQSVYGEIDATVYLRRFFDMEFILPETTSEEFCRNLLDRFRFAEFFAELGESANTDLHIKEFKDLAEWIPFFWGEFGMSLRDIGYSVRMIALVCKVLEPKHYMYPFLLSVLIPVKLTNQKLYRQFIQGECHASGVLNHLDSMITITNSTPITHSIDAEHIMDAIEVQLYRAESQRYEDSDSRNAVLQLTLLLKGEELTHRDLLTERTQRSDEKRIEKLIGLSRRETMPGYWGNMIDQVAKMIDLHQSFVRR